MPRTSTPSAGACRDLTHFCNASKWPQDTMSTAQFLLQKLLDDTVLKGYIARVGWRAGQACILGASDRESTMVPQELIAPEICSIGARAEGSASVVLAGRPRKDRNHPLQPKPSPRTSEKVATPAKRNFHCPGLIVRSSYCHAAPIEHAAAAWRNLNFW